MLTQLGSMTIPAHRGERLAHVRDPGLAHLLPAVAAGARLVLRRDAFVLLDARNAADEQHRMRELVRIDGQRDARITAQRAELRRAGASRGRMRCYSTLLFQWNRIGTRRGLPSSQL